MEEKSSLKDTMPIWIIFVWWYGLTSFITDWVPTLDGVFEPHSRLYALISAAGVAGSVGYRRWQSSRRQAQLPSA